MLNGIYKAVPSDHLSKRYDQRFVIVHLETGEILDDAQGYGYKSKPKAYRAYAYKLKQAAKRKQKKTGGKRKWIKMYWNY